MKKLILLISATFLFAANLINVDFFSHKKFVDVLFSLDSKFDGKVIKLSNNEYYLKNIKYDKEIYKKFNTDYLKSIEITPYENGIKVKIEGNDYTTKFDLTPEGYGIRLRIKSKIVKNNEVKQLMAQNSQNSIDYFTYFIMLAILLILAIILWIIKKKSPKLPVKKDIPMGVLIQKPIDAKNKIVLYEFNKRKYLMLIGNTNLLLDVFDEEMMNVSTKKEFDEFLKINNKIDEVKKYIKNAEELKEFDERI
jgi:hypothetical protein